MNMNRRHFIALGGTASLLASTGISFGAGVVGGVRFAVADRSSVYLEAGLDYLVTSLLVPTLAVGAEFGF